MNTERIRTAQEIYDDAYEAMPEVIALRAEERYADAMVKHLLYSRSEPDCSGKAIAVCMKLVELVGPDHYVSERAISRIVAWLRSLLPEGREVVIYTLLSFQNKKSIICEAPEFKLLATELDIESAIRK